MTRATLLHVLDRPTALGPAEVRELEQLAQAFPYCQTAHLLLAKAAHDQGTMLASQRLRRAATYAADRALLRRLIEQVEPAIAAEPAPEETPVAVAPVAIAAPLIANIPAEPEQLTLSAQPAEAPALEVPRPQPPAVASSDAIALVPAVPTATPAVDLAPTETPIITRLADVLPIAAPGPLPAQVVSDEVLVSEAVIPAPEPEKVAETTDTLEVVVAPQPTVAPILADQQSIELPEAILPVVPAFVAAAPVAAVVPAAEEVTDEIPAVAPAIRPPVEAGEARFEFGLAETAPPATPVYELPGLIDEWAAAATTLSLGSPTAVAPALAAPVTPVFTPAAFTGDATVGYAFGESSRLGFSMQLLNLLAAKAETAESNTAVVAAAQPAAMPLPPAGAFFEPDPLLTDHWATHCPPPPALPSSLDLINNFLKRQPRLTRPGMLPPAPGGQADLSVRSTRAEPDLVSENLARIFIRQGKTARAIEIYEKLMVKQPEKMAYFAAQIQSLQPSA